MSRRGELCNHFYLGKCRLGLGYNFPDIQIYCSGRINSKEIWWLTQFISFLRRNSEEILSLCVFSPCTSHAKIRIIMAYLPSRRKPMEICVKMSATNRTKQLSKSAKVPLFLHFLSWPLFHNMMQFNHSFRDSTLKKSITILH